jgi:hypothetical protein
MNQQEFTRRAMLKSLTAAATVAAASGISLGADELVVRVKCIRVQKMDFRIPGYFSLYTVCR